MHLRLQNPWMRAEIFIIGRARRLGTLLFNQQVSTLSAGGCKKSDKDIGEEMPTWRAAQLDRYANTNSGAVIDKPVLTTEGRKLSTIIG